MPTITAAIMTKNEALDIASCIESVLWMDEVIILDSGSTDGTQDICRKYNVKLFATDWPGFGEQSNRCIEMSNSDWCFLLDADEKVTPELKDDIIQAINNVDNIVAYRVPRLNFFHKRAIKHCLNPKKDTPMRLVKKGFAQYAEIVHPTVKINGKTGMLKNYLLHYPFQNLAELLDKMNSYSTLSAEKLFTKKVKSGVVKALSHAIWSFIKLYFLKGGFLDGWPGLLIAFGNFEGTFYRYAKLMELGHPN